VRAPGQRCSAQWDTPSSRGRLDSDERRLLVLSGRWVPVEDVAFRSSNHFQLWGKPLELAYVQITH
jgi:hypothetical protein